MLKHLTRHRLAKALYYVIAVGFLGFGLIRLSVASTALAQVAGWVNFEDIGLAISDVERFMSEHADQSLYTFGVVDYFAYIAAMGIVLIAGAMGALRLKLGGLKLIGIYLVMHAALFVNAMVINPKVFLLGFTVAMLGLLTWIRPIISKKGG